MDKGNNVEARGQVVERLTFSRKVEGSMLYKTYNSVFKVLKKKGNNVWALMV